MIAFGHEDYDRKGVKTTPGIFAGRVTSGGDFRTTQAGKAYATASVRAFSNQDGTATFITIKSFGEYVGPISALRKGDNILCAGPVSSREYNGKTYHDMMVDFLITDKAAAPAAANAPAAAAGGDDFTAMAEGEEELPF